MLQVRRDIALYGCGMHRVPCFFAQISFSCHKVGFRTLIFGLCAPHTTHHGAVFFAKVTAFCAHTLVHVQTRACGCCAFAHMHFESPLPGIHRKTSRNRTMLGMMTLFNTNMSYKHLANATRRALLNRNKREDKQ